MPLKVYSKEKKEQIRLLLLETALKMYSQNGIKNISLQDILKIVGISKPFFYTFFASAQEFVIRVLEHQWSKFPQLLDEIDMQLNLDWEKKVFLFLKKMINFNESGFLIMTQEEEVWVRNRLGDEEYNAFMDYQLLFFEDLLSRWDVPKGKYNLKVMANMILTIIIVHCSAKPSFPFLYLDNLDETANEQCRALIAYIKLLKEQ